MLRTISKVAGSAAAAAAASVSPAAAHVDTTSPAKFQEASNSRLAKPYGSPYFVEEEYDFCQEDLANGGEFLSKLGGAPSQEEAEDATRELRATFVQMTPSARSQGPTIEEGPSTEVESVSIPASRERCYDVQELTTATVNHWGNSSPDHNVHALTTRGNGVVARCVDLLQRDPDVQAAVVSLARDPAIWDAFVKNEKVQELMRSRQMNLPQLDVYQTIGGCTSQQDRLNPFLVALHCMKNVLWEMMDTLVDIVNNVFGFVDRKIFGENDSDPLDKPFKACMVLTILVLALVVLKRSPTAI